MLLFLMDTSGPVAGVSLLKDGNVIYEAMAVNRFTHSASIMPMTDDAFRHTGLSVTDVDVFGVVVGPGSFTGVRIGVSTVKAMAHGAGRPCVGVDALQAMAASVPYFDGVICPIQDARAGQVYGAAFEAGEVPTSLLDDAPIAIENFAEKVSALGKKCLFLGDGMPVYRERLREIMGEQAVFAPASSSYLRPAAAALLASHMPTTDYLSLMPLYLRAPSAERLKDRLGKKENNG